MQWNVLADSFATRDSFPFVDPRLLSWEVRREKIAQVFSDYAEDIIGIEVYSFNSQVFHSKDSLSRTPFSTGSGSL
jgi:mRNA deadenylase 3'-5' endonuclease subunit Ccr4